LRVIFWLVVLLLGLGLWIHANSRGVMRKSEVLRIPGAASVQAAWLPKEVQPPNLTIDQAARLDAAGAFVPIPPPEMSTRLNRSLSEDRWYRLTSDNSQALPRPVVLDLIWRTYDEVTLYQPQPDGAVNVTRIAPRIASEVDPTGAGDIFATAFIIRMQETGNPVESARFANVTASYGVEHLGIDGIPSRETVLAYMERFPFTPEVEVWRP